MRSHPISFTCFIDFFYHSSIQFTYLALFCHTLPTCLRMSSLMKQSRFVGIVWRRLLRLRNLTSVRCGHSESAQELVGKHFMHHFEWVNHDKTSINGPFSIAILSNQRVIGTCGRGGRNRSISLPDLRKNKWQIGAVEATMQRIEDYHFLFLYWAMLSFVVVCCRWPVINFRDFPISVAELNKRRSGAKLPSGESA